MRRRRYVFLVSAPFIPAQVRSRSKVGSATAAGAKGKTAQATEKGEEALSKESKEKKQAVADITQDPRVNARGFS